MIEVSELGRTFTVTRKAGRFRRTREEVTAVGGVSFEVSAGYIGPNWAGKSTLE